MQSAASTAHDNRLNAKSRLSNGVTSGLWSMSVLCGELNRSMQHAIDAWIDYCAIVAVLAGAGTAGLNVTTGPGVKPLRHRAS